MGVLAGAAARTQSRFQGATSSRWDQTLLLRLKRTDIGEAFEDLAVVATVIIEKTEGDEAIGKLVTPVSPLVRHHGVDPPGQEHTLELLPNVDPASVAKVRVWISLTWDVDLATE